MDPCLEPKSVSVTENKDDLLYTIPQSKIGGRRDKKETMENSKASAEMASRACSSSLRYATS